MGGKLRKCGWGCIRSKKRRSIGGISRGRLGN